MRKRPIQVEQIIEFLGERLLAVYGSTKDIAIDNLSDVDHITTSTLDWINPNKPDKQKIAESSPARVMLVDSSVQYNSAIKDLEKTILVVNNPKVELARIGNHFFVEPAESKKYIHETCVIDPESIISDDVSIGAYSVVGKAQIGKGTVIGAYVRIYDDVTIGESCRIMDGVVIGGAGFGFERDDEGNLFRFPQIGDVSIGKFVEIGANTCIDRGALSTTHIDDYTKINNLCHIAHNNCIGKNVVIAAHVNLSGGNVIEDDCWIAPSSSLRGYIHVGKGAVVGTGAVVVKDIPSGEVWLGNPAKKYK